MAPKPSKRVAPVPIKVAAIPPVAVVPIPPATDPVRAVAVIDVDATPLDGRNYPAGVPYGGI